MRIIFTLTHPGTNNPRVRVWSAVSGFYWRAYPNHQGLADSPHQAIEDALRTLGVQVDTHMH